MQHETNSPFICDGCLFPKPACKCAEIDAEIEAEHKKHSTLELDVAHYIVQRTIDTLAQMQADGLPAWESLPHIVFHLKGALDLERRRIESQTNN
jgi:hypothetical protein